MADLKFKDLIAETRESKAVEPLNIDLGDGKKAIVLHEVPLRLFTAEIVLDERGDGPRLMMELLERVFPVKEWPRVEAVLQEAPVGAVGEMFKIIFDHFGLVFSDGEAGKDSEDSGEDSDE